MRLLHTIIKSFWFASKGLQRALRERSMRMHLITSLVVIILGFYLNISSTDWIVIVFAIGIVISAEVTNTAIESVVNVIRDDGGISYEKVGVIKDLVAGAVVVVSIAAVIVGLIVFIPYISL